MDYSEFFEELNKRKQKVYDYLHSSRFQQLFKPKHIYDSVYSYLRNSGKALRPCVMLFSCGAVGGNEEAIIPAAAAIEVFHIWTMVHDDIIDKDHMRRGGPTVHEEFRQRAESEFGYSSEDAIHYGLSIAMLAGDMQQGWAVSMLSELSLQDGFDPNLILYLIKDSEMRIQSELIEGQVLDIQYSKQPIELLTESQILKVMWKKTGVLYEFAGKAGAMLGLNTTDKDHPLVKSISQFTGNCGIAFQLQDDILGIVGKEESLGKPVDSDIREGKRTLILCHAFSNANARQKDIINSVVGNPSASREQIDNVKRLLIELGGIEYTKQKARSFVEKALTFLKDIPDSKYKELLHTWAQYMVDREF